MLGKIRIAASIACIVSIVAIFNSCECYEYVPNLFKFGTYQARIHVADKVSLGDKIVVSLVLPKYFYDSLSGNQIIIDKNIGVFFKLDEFVVDTVSSGNFFAVPETILKRFDEYFDLKVIKGQSINVYNFECAEENNEWKVLLEYTAKKKGRFYFDVHFVEINTSQAKLPKHTCWSGDALFDAKLEVEGDNNKIEEMFEPNSYYIKQLFGIVVE